MILPSWFDHPEGSFSHKEGEKVLPACENYNLGQNRMRNRSTPPLNSMMHSRYKENAPFFHH